MKKLLYTIILFLTFTSPVFAADVKNHATLPTGLISYWELEEASGTRVDSTATGNDLTDNNTVTTATGKQGEAALFTAANTEYLTITDASQSGLEGMADLSISFWIKFTSSPAIDTGFILYDKDWTGGDRAYHMRYYNDNGAYKLWAMIYTVTEGQLSTVEYVNTFSTGTWYHFVMVYDSSGQTITTYVNNSQVAQITGEGGSAVNSNSTRFTIGANDTNGSPFDGVIDEFGMWSKTLSSGERSDLYNSGAGIPYDEGVVEEEEGINSVIIISKLIKWFKNIFIYG